MQCHAEMTYPMTYLCQCLRHLFVSFGRLKQVADRKAKIFPNSKAKPSSTLPAFKNPLCFLCQVNKIPGKVMAIEISEEDIPPVPPPSSEAAHVLQVEASDYYTQGSKELAIETPVTVRRLELVSIRDSRHISIQIERFLDQRSARVGRFNDAKNNMASACLTLCSSFHRSVRI